MTYFRFFANKSFTQLHFALKSCFLGHPVTCLKRLKRLVAHNDLPSLNKLS